MIHEESWTERLLRALSGEPEPDPRILNSSVESRPLMLAWWLWFAAIVVIIVAVLSFSGCAQAPSVPLCEQPTFELGVDRAAGRRLYALDEANMRTLIAMTRGLAEGTCRMPPPANGV